MSFHPSNKPATRHIDCRIHMCRQHVELGHVTSEFKRTGDLTMACSQNRHLPPHTKNIPPLFLVLRSPLFHSSLSSVLYSNLSREFLCGGRDGFINLSKLFISLGRYNRFFIMFPLFKNKAIQEHQSTRTVRMESIARAHMLALAECSSQR
jgi:hypothetical protein